MAAAALTPPSTGLFSPRRHTGRLEVEEKEGEEEVGEVEVEEEEEEKVEDDSAAGQAQDFPASQALLCGVYTRACAHARTHPGVLCSEFCSH